VRAIATRPSPRDRVLALPPVYAGLRVSETVALNTDDLRLSARKGNLRVRGKGTTVRDLPIHPQLRNDLQTWLDERPGWPGAGTSPALLLNRRGQRLSVRGASNIIRAIAADANLDEEHITAHVGRHTFATTLYQFPRRHRPGRRRRHARPRPPRHRSPLHPPQRRRPRTSPQSPAI